MSHKFTPPPIIDTTKIVSAEQINAISESLRYLNDVDVTVTVHGLGGSTISNKTLTGFKIRSGAVSVGEFTGKKEVVIKYGATYATTVVPTVSLRTGQIAANITIKTVSLKDVTVVIKAPTDKTKMKAIIYWIAVGR